MNDRDVAAGLLERTIQAAREEGSKLAIPANVRDAWEKVRTHIIHDGAMDDYRFELEDYFNGIGRLPNLALRRHEQFIETYHGYHITKEVGWRHVSIWTPDGQRMQPDTIESQEAARRLIDAMINERGG